MADRSAIEWTEATWNPMTGCTKVSPGCDHCYAETFAERFRGTPGHYFERGFDVQLRPDKLDLPLRWRRPRRIFVNSMSDLFHDQVPEDYIARVFAVMARAPRHTFQVLTKRHGRMRSLLSSEAFVDDVADRILERADLGWAPIELRERWWPLPNVWLGVSAESQQWADIRIPALLDTPSAVRWVSAEPLLGPIELARKGYITCRICRTGHVFSTEPCDPLTPARFRTPNLSTRAALDWVVVGGESGRGARPMHPDWARSLRDQCEAAGIAFLFKQHGEWAPIGPLYGDSDEVDEAHMEAVHLEVHERRQVIQMERSGEIVEPEQYQPTDPRTWLLARVGKKAAGRALDGLTHDGYPAVTA